MANKKTPLAAVPPAKRQKSEKELEIERLAKLTPEALSHDDLRILKRMRDCRSSVTECENELQEVKDRLKERKKTLDQAIREACDHYENRQLALGFSGG